MKNQLISSLESLANKIERDESNSKESFSDISFDVLERFSTNLDLAEFENAISQWVLENHTVKQLNVYDGFGQPPITIFNNGKFVVDIYFWLNIDTSIHSHSFSGAFKVLFGRSVHETYAVNPIKEFSPDMIMTDICHINTELLNAGSCRKIVSGNNFNHRLIHLDCPTITLCVRTIHKNESKQFHHLPNGLSIEKVDLDEFVLKKIFFFNYLVKIDEAKARQFLLNLTLEFSLAMLLSIYEKISFGGIDLEEDSANIFHEVFEGKFGNTEWFQLYQSFYQELEKNYIEINGDSPESRFLEHALSFNYSYEVGLKVLRQIRAAPLNEEQLSLLDMLKS